VFFSLVFAGEYCSNQKILSKRLTVILERRLDKLIRWLAPTQYSIKQEESLEKHQAGTGKWLFDHAKYRKWRESSTSALWVHGIAGCGKTILA
jgi:4-alpha-glucanotransferase